MKTSINLEINDSVKFLIILGCLIISVVFFLYGSFRSAQIIADMSIPASEIVLPVSSFIGGFIGTFLSAHFFFNFGDDYE